MSILIVDDVADHLTLLEAMLCCEGHEDIVQAGSAFEAFTVLDLEAVEAGVASTAPVDLILMDVRMPGTDGILACRRIKSCAAYRDIPIIIVTAETDADCLQQAFEAGAMDFIGKPIDRIELVTRVRSALALKRERDLRRDRERELLGLTHQLEEANRRLERLSSLDGLTGLANRRALDGFLEMEWRRTRRDQAPLSVILIDVDQFKPYNDAYGHQAGDECLRRVADVLGHAAHRPGDMVARYGGEEFAVVLSQTGAAGARAVAEGLRAQVEALRIPHSASSFGIVTISLGIATALPASEAGLDSLLRTADAALYRAKRAGRNRVEAEPSDGGDNHRMAHATQTRRLTQRLITGSASTSTRLRPARLAR
jgi:diguanylate cyclase (GGDEF)-like protein